MAFSIDLLSRLYNNVALVRVCDIVLGPDFRKILRRIYDRKIVITSP